MSKESENIENLTNLRVQSENCPKGKNQENVRKCRGETLPTENCSLLA